MADVSSIRKAPADRSWIGKVPLSRIYRITVVKKMQGAKNLTYDEAVEAAKKNKRRYPKFDFIVEKM